MIAPVIKLARSEEDGCGFMTSSEPLRLPNLGLAIRMPNCVRLRADGSDEVAGIRPDVPVLARDGESARARAGRLLRALSADVTRPRAQAAAGSP
jgi:hypothetical protein